MQPDNLIKMANQIAAFFAAMPDQQEAVQSVANHINRYWEPRMRKALCELSVADRQDLQALARTAVETQQINQ
jgi:formate dehydrogenase subunit delta